MIEVLVTITAWLEPLARPYRLVPELLLAQRLWSWLQVRWWPVLQAWSWPQALLWLLRLVPQVSS